MAREKRLLCIGRTSLLAACCGIASSGFMTQAIAAEFFTIIGPDGRPMVVQQRPEKKSKPADNVARPQKQTDQDSSQNQPQSSSHRKVTGQTQPSNAIALPQSHAIETKPNKSKPIKSEPTQSNTSVENESKLHSKTPQQHGSKGQATQESDQSIPENPKDRQPQVQNQQKQTSQKKSSDVLGSIISESKLDRTQQVQEQNTTKHQTQNVDSKILNSIQVPSTSASNQTQKAQPSSVPSTQAQQDGIKQATTQHVPKPHQNITEIDGVQYVDNEYLEDKEFNIEGRKRFYVMPDSSIAGSSRFETVEREKGISKSVFSKFLNNAPKASPPVVLAPTYYRLPKDQVVQNLEQACFSGKKIDKAKELSLDNTEVGFWPVPPIKEKFVYDVVKLDSSVENIHFSSYASSQKNPTYYWPLVVFLDQQGCVIEGVSGFKNQDTAANQLKFSALEGVLKKPKQAKYLFMTPLAEAIDVEQVQLSNKGQIKLSVLR